MNLLVVGKNKGSLRIKEEGEKRGHFVDLIHSSDLWVMVDNKRLVFRLMNKELLLKDYDVLFTYTLSRRVWNWLLFLRHIRRKYPKLKIVYEKYADPKYKLYHTSLKEMILQHKKQIPFPASVVFFTKQGLKKAAKYLGFPMIIKVRQPGMYQKGRGVFLAHNLKEAREIIERHPKAYSYIAREFIPNDGDYRLFVVGYKVVAIMKRIPPPGDFRSNISQGGKGVGVKLSEVPELVSIAEKVSKVTRTEIAGVDIMVNKETGKPYVLEVNHGPQFAGIEKATGINIAAKIVDYFEKLAK